jgi:hypothetical protein
MKTKRSLYVRPVCHLHSETVSDRVARGEKPKLTQENPLNSAWSRVDSCPCTGVNVGCSFVNSSSKLLVSALPFCKKPSYNTPSPNLAS